MVLNKTILILEDNLLILSKILERLYTLEQNQPFELSIIVITNYKQVEELVNSNPSLQLDVILLDRDCKLNRSFHVLNIEQFGVERVIAISSVPEYNEEARERGVKKVVLKDLQDVDGFSSKVVREVERMITPSRLRKFFNRCAKL